MGQRLQLQSLLEGLLGSRNVYFQPPSTVQMKYPAIVYNRDSTATKFADDKPYSNTKRYMATIIDRNPDSEIPDKIAMMPLTTFVRHFTADDLNHDIFNIYF